MLPEFSYQAISGLSAVAGNLAAVIPWLALAGFGAYHGLNPGMGWLFALSLGLQQRNPRAIWVALVPITVGHMAAVALTAVVVLVGLRFISLDGLQWLTAIVLFTFGVYKVFNYYRHPKWVGMRVGMKDLTWWSFLMALAHGAGLMIAPVLVGVAGGGMDHTNHAEHFTLSGAVSGNLALAIGVHSAAMLAIMAATAWLVYRKFGLMILRRGWVNFDLVWAVALLAVGIIALLNVGVPALAHFAQAAPDMPVPSGHLH
jgi:hypothetical protein